MQYLLDELNAHENDHSDALALEQPPAGEAALAQPVMMETAHDAVLVADVRVLQVTVNRISTSMDKVSASQMAMSDDVKSLREQLSNMANHSLSNCVCLEFKSPVQSGFFAFFGRKPDWTALGSLGMVPGPLKDWSKVVATGFSKNRSKTSQNQSKTGQNC